MKANISNIQLIFGLIPKRFSVNGTVTDGYDKLTEQHYKDGWRDVVTEKVKEDEKLSDLFVLENDIVVKKAIKLTTEELAEKQESLIPNRLTASQLRQALVIKGYTLQSILDAINSLPSPQKDIMLIRWEYEQHYNRTSEEVKSISMAIGLTEEALKEIFKLGSKL